MKHRISYAGAALGLALAACSGAPPSDGAPDYVVDKDKQPPPAATSDGSEQQPPPDAGSEADASSPEVPVVKPSTAYAGTLAMSSAVPFGGGKYCNYEVQLKSVAAEITVLDDTGDVAKATVSDTAVEKTVGSCPYAPSPPSNQVFTLETATKTTNGMHLVLAGAKGNQPAASLVGDLVKNGDGYAATFTWKRTDQGAPLAWTVTAKITLARK